MVSAIRKTAGHCTAWTFIYPSANSLDYAATMHSVTHNQSCLYVATKVFARMDTIRSDDKRGRDRIDRRMEKLCLERRCHCWERLKRNQTRHNTYLYSKGSVCWGNARKKTKGKSATNILHSISSEIICGSAAPTLTARLLSLLLLGEVFDSYNG